MWCSLHGATIDIWYDCPECLAESDLWARAHGYEQCVSPYITRAGTDNGAWVQLNHSRWRCCSCCSVRPGVGEPEEEPKQTRAGLLQRPWDTDGLPHTTHVRADGNPDG